MAINRDVLKSDGKVLTVDEEVLKGNEKAIKDNEKALKGNEEAYHRETRRRQWAARGVTEPPRAL